MLEKMISCKIERRWSGLITYMLKKNPEKRPSIEDIIK